MGVGAAVVWYRGGVEGGALQRGLGRHAEVYDAEVMALAEGAGKAWELKRPEILHYHFFADNSSGIGAAFDADPGPSQDQALIFRKFVVKLLAHPRRTVEIAWVPGHQGVQGNERADELAKEAAYLPAVDRATYAHMRRSARHRALVSWTQKWVEDPVGGSYAQARLGKPALKPPHHSFALSRQVYGLVTQCRTGHVFLGEYYRRFVPSEDIACPCGHPLQTRAHVLMDCGLYDEHRPILAKVSRDIAPQIVLGTRKGIEALAKFIAMSGAFTKTGNQSVE